MPKGLVDIALGALAFLAGADRLALSIAHSAAVLPVYLTSWVVIVLVALLYPGLIGGGSPAERFAELGPVIVLSVPIIWIALKNLHFCLDLYDSVVGASALIHRRFALLSGLEGTLSPTRMSGSITIEHQTVNLRNTSPGAMRANSLSLRFMSYGSTLDVADVKDDTNMQNSNDMENVLVGSSLEIARSFRHMNLSLSSVYADRSLVRWHSDMVPMARESLMAPVQRRVVTTFTNERYTICDSEAQNYRIKGFYKKVLGRLRSGTRNIRRQFRLWSRGTTSGASIEDFLIVDDNLSSTWKVNRKNTSDSRTSRRLDTQLMLRRGAMMTVKYFVSSIQGAVFVLTSAFDYLITRLAVLCWTLVWEVVHPLSIRREHAPYVVQGTLSLVVDRPKIHSALLSFLGKDAYLLALAEVVTLRVIFTVLAGSPVLIREAIVMWFVGVRWRVKPQTSSPRLSEAVALATKLGLDELIPFNVGRDIDLLMPLPANCGREEAAGIRMAVENGLIPLVVVRKKEAEIGARKEELGNEPGGPALSEWGKLKWGTPLFSYQAKATAWHDFDKGKWLGSLSDSNLEVWFDDWLDDVVDEHRKQCLTEMENIAMDCHMTMRRMLWSGRSVGSEELVPELRHKTQQHDMLGLIPRSDAHEMLVALHKRVVRSALCLFIDEYQNGVVIPWLMWALTEACWLRTLIESEIKVYV